LEQPDSPILRVQESKIKPVGSLWNLYGREWAVKSLNSMASATRVVVSGCASFCYLLLLYVLGFTYLFFVLVFYLLPLAFVPALYSTTECGVSWLCTWYFYRAIMLGYDFPLPIVLF